MSQSALMHYNYQPVARFQILNSVFSDEWIKILSFTHILVTVKLNLDFYILNF